MPTTGNNLLPYPNTSDAPNIPQAISELASAVDTAIGGGGRIYQTLAELQAVPSAQLFEGMRAFVVADSTATNNREYAYKSGTWVSATKFLRGSVVATVTTGDSIVRIMTLSDISTLAGKTLAQSTFTLTAHNGNNQANTGYIKGTTIDGNSINAFIVSSSSVKMQINWMAILD